MKINSYFILLFFCSINIICVSQTHVWTDNANDGDWHNVMNWNTNSIPNASSNVVIPENSSVTISQTNALANSIEINPFSNLNIEEDLSVSQNITITENADIFWYQGTISGGVIENDGRISIETFEAKDLSNITINNRNTITITNSTVIRLFNTTTINNAITGELVINSNGGIIEQNSGIATINNEGLVKKIPSETGGAFYMIFDMNNSGIIDVGQNQTFLFLTIGQGFNNLENGTLQGTGAFDITSNFLNSGAVSPGGENTVGNLEIVNNFSLDATAKLIIDIDGPATENYDLVSIFGSPDLNGTIRINLNYDAAIGDTFTVLTAALGIDSCNFPSQITASFNGFNYIFNVICNSNALILEVADVTLNIDDYKENPTRFFVTPNPVSNTSKFVVSNTLDTDEASISIYNYLGQELSKSSAYSIRNFDLNNLTSGLYFAQLKLNNGILATTRFIIP